MILTEEEAKTKWCPETRVHVVPDMGGVYVNKPLSESNTYGYATEKSVMCIGSACMAWRWATNGGHYEAVAPNHHGPSFARLIPGTGTLSTTHGYCGKAGKS